MSFSGSHYWLLYMSKERYCTNMLAVLLIPWVISTSSASILCPESSCRCPYYTTAICTGSLSDNFTNFLDARVLNLTLQATNITEVACSTIPEGIEKLLLLRNQKLKKVSFSCDWISTIRHLEISATKMSELYPITEQHIVSLNSSDYPTLPSLQKLYLHNLRIRNHLDLLLKFFSNVTEFHLNFCEIKPLVKTDPKLPYVQLLDLSYNPIFKISAQYFRSMINLKTLQLEWTKLSNIARDIFHPLEKLSLLRLDGNNFTSFEDDTFLQLNNLLKLRLSKNQIKHFQSALTRNLTKLEELYLNDNELTELEEQVFDPLVSLKVLNLTQNVLRNIQKNIFKKQQKLLKLYLGWNRLERIEAATFAPLRNLHTLNLERNRLTFLEEATFEKLSNLKLLNLSGNLLMEISGVQFPQRAMLQKLLLQQNSLENIDPITFRPLEQLETLRLDGNNFRNVNLEVFEFLDNMKYLNMSECSMLECSCTLEELWRLCKARNITLADGAICSDGNCSMPWSNMKICPLEKSEEDYTYIIIAAGVLILIVLISIPVVKYLLKRSRSDTSTWCPQNNTNVDNSQNILVAKEEGYGFGSEEENAGFSTFSMVQQEDYIEPTISKVNLPVCVPVENSRKAKRRKVSLPSQPVVPSAEITVPRCRAPAAPPEDYQRF